jgi:hypothetical protein
MRSLQVRSQARGRPFGNVELALLASERLAWLTGLADAAEPCSSTTLSPLLHQVHVRDYGVQLLHVGDVSQGSKLLLQHATWIDRGAATNGEAAAGQGRGSPHAAVANDACNPDAARLVRSALGHIQRMSGLESTRAGV